MQHLVLDTTADREILRRARLTTWLAGLLALVVGFATCFRPLVSDVGTLFTIAGVVNTALFAGAWLALRRGLCAAQAPVILIGIATLAAFPLILVSGGPNSQFAPLVPLFPICGVMIGGRRMAIGTMIFWLVALPLMLELGDVVPDLTGETWHVEKAASRTLWLDLSMMVAAAFALHFEHNRQRLQDRLVDMAERDPLTGVANRRGLDAALARTLAFAARHDTHATLMVVDVDFFKRFNDSRGHAEGDLALTRIARTLVAHCREGEDTVARYGGEEFVIVLGDTDRVGARSVADKMRAAIRKLALRYDDRSTDMLTATIGFVAVNGGEPLSTDDLLRKADAALYEGKRRGRDQTVDADSVDVVSLDKHVSRST